MSPRFLYWKTLELSTPLAEEQVTAALTALCTLSGSPFVTLEARGENREVSWRLGCDPHDLSRIADVLSAHLPGLHVTDSRERDDVPDAVARLQFRGSANRPLASGAALTTTRTLLAALARASKNESVTLQLTLGPRQRPTMVRDPRGKDERTRAQKWSSARFGVDLRVGAVADDPARVHSLVSGVIAAARTLEVPGVGLAATRTSIDGFDRVSLPWFWRSELSPAELVSLTAWPIGTPPLPGVRSPHPVRLRPTDQIPERGLVLGNATALLPKVRRIAITPADQIQGHLHIIGPSGVGKSNLMISLALQDIDAGHGLCFIDPKGDAVEELLARIPSHRLGDVVVIDPRDSSPVGIASLQGDPDRVADVLLGVFHSLYSDNWGPRSHDILHAGLLTLARRGDASLVLLPTLLTNTGFRRSVTQRAVRDDPLGLGSFWGWYESLSEAERQQAIAPVMNKLRPILLRPGMRHTLGQRRPRFELRDIFTKNRIVLVSLAKGQLGPEAAALLGSLVVALLWDTITAQASVESPRRSRVGIYIDEVQDYLRLPGDLGDALAQARGYGAKVALAHQHLGQLGTQLREAILANARSRVMFGMSHHDATDLSRMSRGQVTADDLELLPAHEAYVTVLANGAQSPWVSLTTSPLGPRLASPKDVRSISADTYGVPASETDAELRGFADPPAAADEQFGRTPKRPRGSS